MVDNYEIENRKNIYFKLNSALSSLSTKEVNKILSVNKLEDGWGATHQIKVSGHKIFVKSIPLTAVEYSSSFCTKNHYRLPTYYNYGVGSAGFGAYRELLTHIKTTNWVLNSEIDNFPLMYHHRVIPKASKAKPIQLDKHQKYLKYWNGSKAIDRYIRERRKASYEIVIFLEHIPYSLNEWLPKNNDKVGMVAAEMYKTIDFLRKKGVIHFDAHLANILSDGTKPYLTDFGLALDKSFKLTPRESDFFKEHSHYDYGEFIGCLGSILGKIIDSMPENRKKSINLELGLSKKTTWYEKQRILLANIDYLKNVSSNQISRKYTNFLKENIELIRLSNKFFYELSQNPKKNTKFENAKTKRLLNDGW